MSVWKPQTSAVMASVWTSKVAICVHAMLASWPPPMERCAWVKQIQSFKTFHLYYSCNYADHDNYANIETENNKVST